MGAPRQGSAADSNTSPSKPDYRLIVLLAAGLLIALQHLPQVASSHQTETSKPLDFVWLETDETRGLFMVSSAEGYATASVYDFFHIPFTESITPQRFRFAPFHSHFFSAATRPFMSQLLPADLAPLLFQPVPVNEASAAILATLPGIGLQTAQKIVDYRNRVGRIKGIDDLTEVSGIGGLRAARLKEHIRY